MSNLSPTEKEYFEELLNLKSTDILKNVGADISFPKLRAIVSHTTGLDIYLKKYEKYGVTMPKLFWAFWEMESDEHVGALLNELLNIYAFKKKQGGESLEGDEIYKQCRNIVHRLSGTEPVEENGIQEFLQKDFGEVSFDKINIEESVKPILEGRLSEAKRGLKAGNPLSVIFMCGSVLEGLLLGIAQKNPKKFNTCNISPKDKDGNTLLFKDWSLSQFINVANELGYLDIDTKKFSHALRDFRNYIHPFEEMKSGFTPSPETAKVCLQVLRAAVVSIGNNTSVPETIIERKEDL